MAKYIYKAVNIDGKNVQGTIEAETAENFKTSSKKLDSIVSNEMESF